MCSWLGRWSLRTLLNYLIYKFFAIYFVLAVAICSFYKYWSIVICLCYVCKQRSMELHENYMQRLIRLTASVTILSFCAMFTFTVIVNCCVFCWIPGWCEKLFSSIDYVLYMTKYYDQSFAIKFIYMIWSKIFLQVC